MAKSNTCLIGDARCTPGRKVQRAGLCNRHYNERRRERLGGCVEPGCTRPASYVSVRLCGSHYGSRRDALVTAICEVDGCPDTATRGQYCNKHHLRNRRHGSPTAGGPDAGVIVAFVHEAVAYKGDGCLLWPFGTVGTGYGILRYEGKRHLAHRLILELVKGPPPHEGMVAAHAPLICHNPLCVSAAHLRWTTQSYNALDTVPDDTHTRGVRKWNAKLNPEKVRFIRTSGFSQKELAEMYGVSRATISGALRRKTWAWLD